MFVCKLFLLPQEELSMIVSCLNVLHTAPLSNIYRSVLLCVFIMKILSCKVSVNFVFASVFYLIVGLYKMCEVVEISDDDEGECIQLYSERVSHYTEESQETNSDLNRELEDLSPVDRKKVVEVLIFLRLYVKRSLG